MSVLRERITPEQINRAHSLWVGGLMINEIAERMGLNRKTIETALKTFPDYTPRRACLKALKSGALYNESLIADLPTDPRAEHTDDQILRLIKSRRGYAAAIARACGMRTPRGTQDWHRRGVIPACHRPTVERMTGRKLAPVKPTEREVKREAVLEMARAGASTAEIAARLEMTECAVRQCAMRSNVSLQRSPRPKRARKTVAAPKLVRAPQPEINNAPIAVAPARSRHGRKINLPRALVHFGFAASYDHACTLCRIGAVKLDGTTIETSGIAVGAGVVITSGQRSAVVRFERAA